MKKTIYIMLIAIVMIGIFNSLCLAAGNNDLTKKTKELGDWLKEDLAGTLGFIGIFIGAAMVIFGNGRGMRQIGMVIGVLCIIASWDSIWGTLQSIFK